MKNVLLVTYHFPPHAGSSGILRALKFCRYLPDRGWMPTVLTVKPHAYERLDNSQMREIPADVKVLRVAAWDSKRHFAIRGRYLRHSALPDRWVSWCLGAIPAGLQAIRQQRIDIIFTTFPIATAVLIGFLLHRLSGKPWVVDFRDSMTEEEYPLDRTTRRLYRWIERQAVTHAARLIFTAPSTRRMYLDRYSCLQEETCLVISNGYDEDDFEHLNLARSLLHPGAQIRLLHTGLVYPSERDPLPFFRALARLKRENKIRSLSLQIDLRGCGHESEYDHALKTLGIEDLVRLTPPIPYHEALQELAHVDGVLLFQGANCNHQIPAKLYEYLRLQKPILALTDHAGDTAALLRETGGATITDMADENAICAGLSMFLSLLKDGKHPVPASQVAARYSRKNQAYELANCLSGVMVENS